MKEANVTRRRGDKDKDEIPRWVYIIEDDNQRSADSKQLEMLESIRNVLEGILIVLKDSEIVYMRGKQKDG